MPEISRFYGVVIKMFFDDHRPPHFHAFYGDQEALIAIHTLAQQELQADWDKAKALEPLQKIAPLP